MKKKKVKGKKQFSLEGLEAFLKRQAEYNRTHAGQWELKVYKMLKELHYKFTFQHPLIYKKKGYIVDFMLTDYPIFIEIDSKQWHSSKEQIRADNLRTRRIKTLGYEPLRFTNRQVTMFTKETIDQIIKSRISQLPPK